MKGDKSMMENGYSDDWLFDDDEEDEEYWEEFERKLEDIQNQERENDSLLEKWTREEELKEMNA
jgi:hypothetical protein